MAIPSLLQIRFSLRSTLLWMAMVCAAMASFRFLPALCSICLVYMTMVLPVVFGMAQLRRLQVERAVSREP